MKKPTFKITKYNGLTPIEGGCTACDDVTFHLMFPDRATKQSALDDLQREFKMHFEHVHLREDASQAAARIVREATERD
jgi:hypothetical protein